MGIDLSRTAKSIALVGADGDGNDQFVLALVRGDHDANEIKLAKVEGLADYRMATEAEILAHLGSEPGFLGPVAPRQPIRVLADREVAAMRSEEHTSELQSLMRISYAVFCLKKKTS